eukprot:UN06663
MKKLDTKIVKSRSREMTKLFRSYVSFGDRIGEKHNVLITEMAKDGYHFVGHNAGYDHFLVPPEPGVSLMGKIVCVEITEVGKYFIKSKIVDVNGSNKLWVDNGIKVKDRNNFVYISIVFSFLVVFLGAFFLIS